MGWCIAAAAVVGVRATEAAEIGDFQLGREDPDGDDAIEGTGSLVSLGSIALLGHTMGPRLKSWSFLANCQPVLVPSAIVCGSL